MRLRAFGSDPAIQVASVELAVETGCQTSKQTYCQNVSGLPSLRLSTPKPNLWEETDQEASLEMSLASSACES
jgi:hypothetical protein